MPFSLLSLLPHASYKKVLAEKHIDINKELRNHNSSRVLQSIDSAIVTGHTGTNVMNLRVVVLKD